MDLEIIMDQEDNTGRKKKYFNKPQLKKKPRRRWNPI